MFTPPEHNILSIGYDRTHPSGWNDKEIHPGKFTVQFGWFSFQLSRTRGRRFWRDLSGRGFELAAFGLELYVNWERY